MVLTIKLTNGITRHFDDAFFTCTEKSKDGYLNLFKGYLIVICDGETIKIPCEQIESISFKH